MTRIKELLKRECVAVQMAGVIAVKKHGYLERLAVAWC